MGAGRFDGKLYLNSVAAGSASNQTLSFNGTTGEVQRSSPLEIVTYGLPTQTGNANKVLQTDGAGNLSWVSAATGSGSAFYLENTLYSDYDTLTKWNVDGAQWKAIKVTGGTGGITVNKTITDTTILYTINAAAAANALSGLTDVALTAPAANNVLSYNAGTSKWNNTAAALMTTASLANNDFLLYSSANSDWRNANATTVTALLNTFTSALKGLVPASGGGTTNYLRADGTWAAPAGGGGGTTYTFTSSSIINTANNLTLSGDAAAPGNNYVYGTNGTGTKGWQAGTTIDMTGFVNGDYVKYDGTKFVRGTPSGGVTNIGLGTATASALPLTSSSGTGVNLPTFSTTAGLVPGTTSSTANFLRADGTWAAPAGGTTYTFNSSSIVNTSGNLALSGDAAAPGNNYVYGTSGAGAKGWQAGTVVDMTGFVNGDYVKYDGTKFVRGTPGGSGTVTGVSVATANGFAGTATATATPVITLTTSVTGMLKGNGTAISEATAGTDYVVPSGSITGTAGNVTGTVAVGNGGTGATTITGLVKGNGTSAMTAAVAGTDYQAPLTSGTNIKTVQGNTLLGAGNVGIADSKGIKFIAPTASENQTIWRVANSVTVSGVDIVLLGTSPSVTYTINYGSTRGTAAGTIVASNTVTTSGAATVSSAVIPANSYVWVTTSATSGTVTDFTITINYTQ
jgi:hypothetical protein